LLGSLVALLLNKGNATQNESTIAALELQPDHAVLDVGFGGGVSFHALLAACKEGKVCGVEISEDMVARANKRWRAQIEAGRMEIQAGGADSLPWSDGTFDRILTVNTLYFWPDLDAGLADMVRVLKPGGRFVASVTPAELLTRVGFDTMGFRTDGPEQHADACRRAGFATVETRATHDGKQSVLIICDAPG